MIELFVVADVVSGVADSGVEAKSVIENVKSFPRDVQSIFKESFRFWSLDKPDDAAIKLQEMRNLKINFLRLGLAVFFFTVPLLAGIFWYRAKRISRKLSQGLIDPQKMWEDGGGFVSNSIYRRKISTSIPILTIANFKGGSGKSTIAANLAAYFDYIGAKVLLIDFDPHASLTELMPSVGEKGVIHDSRSLNLLLREEEMSSYGNSGLRFRPQKVGGSFNKSYILTADQELVRAENDTLMELLTGKKTRGTRYGEREGVLGKIKSVPHGLQNWWWRLFHRGRGDVRFNAFHYLINDQIQEPYDVVIIDTSSHLTPAFINALCASTHLLVPTPLDNISVKVTTDSLGKFNKLKKKLGLNFEVMGVLPSITKDNNAGTLVSRQQKIADETSFLEAPLWVDQRVPHKAEILGLENTNDLVFFNDHTEKKVNVIRNIFMDLGEHIVLSGGRFEKLGQLHKERLFRGQSATVKEAVSKPSIPLNKGASLDNSVSEVKSRKAMMG